MRLYRMSPTFELRFKRGNVVSIDDLDGRCGTIFTCRTTELAANGAAMGDANATSATSSAASSSTTARSASTTTSIANGANAVAASTTAMRARNLLLKSAASARRRQVTNTANARAADLRCVSIEFIFCAIRDARVVRSEAIGRI